MQLFRLFNRRPWLPVHEELSKATPFALSHICPDNRQHGHFQFCPISSYSKPYSTLYILYQCTPAQSMSDTRTDTRHPAPPRTTQKLCLHTDSLTSPFPRTYTIYTGSEKNARVYLICIHLARKPPLKSFSTNRFHQFSKSHNYI